jgi:hypothetical protein
MLVYQRVMRLYPYFLVFDLNQNDSTIYHNQKTYGVYLQ